MYQTFFWQRMYKFCAKKWRWQVYISASYITLNYITFFFLVSRTQELKLMNSMNLEGDKRNVINIAMLLEF